MQFVLRLSSCPFVFSQISIRLPLCARNQVQAWEYKRKQNRYIPCPHGVYILVHDEAQLTYNQINKVISDKYLKEIK